MTRLDLYFAAALLGCGVLTGCSTPVGVQPPAAPTPLESPPPLATPNEAAPRPSASGPPPVSATVAPTATPPTTAVTLYQPDAQCLDLVPQEVTVPMDAPVNRAVGEIVRRHAQTDFRVTQYDVAIEGDTATVDLQVAPDAKRSFNSLSACEQMALFGSIQKTLTANPQWRIQTVEFTERGKELIF